jgi:hypothetical protein
MRLLLKMVVATTLVAPTPRATICPDLLRMISPLRASVVNVQGSAESWNRELRQVVVTTA